MSPSSYYTIAQIAITLTGFIAIIIAIQHDDTKFSNLAIVTILGTTVGAMIFSFIPEMLMSITDETTAWRISNGTFGIYHLGLILNHQARQLQFKKNSPVQLIIVLLSIFLVVGLKLAVALGFFLDYANVIFFFGLLWCVFIPLYLFSMIILDINKN